ncbi:MAG: mannitol-1-phosphate 5-dehydrogenase [Anaerolineae bacterium]
METDTSRPAAVIFGAGSVGRGFLGQLFSESGYDVVFVDVDDALVTSLQQRGVYTLRLAGVVKVEERTIGPVRAVDGRDVDAVAREVAQAAVIATAVGARALSAVAIPIASGLERRWKTADSTPLNVIVCENLHDAPGILNGHVAAALPQDQRGLLDGRVGFAPAVIARMSPVPTAEQRAVDPTLIVAEPYKILPVDEDALVGEGLDVVGLMPVSPFEAYTDRKLYIHNAGHAILGYLGYQAGHEYGYEALDDPGVRSRLDQGLGEARRALIAVYGFEPVALQEHIDYLLVRFANRALGDPVARLARDPLRKLSPSDRLVGAARLAERNGIEPKGLAWGIAAALRYDNSDDGHAVRLQQQIETEGIAHTLATVCDIAPDEPLGKLVLARYYELGT